MKRPIAALLSLLLLACQKEKTIVEVGFFVQCGQCAIEYGIEGGTLVRDTLGTDPFRTKLSAEVGGTAVITGTPLVPSARATGVAISLNGFQKAFDFVKHPGTVTVRVPVVAVNRYGEPE